MNCNSRKRDISAPDFLRILYREEELSRKDLTARLAALRALAAGKLPPNLSAREGVGIPVGAKGGENSDFS